jgi:hypothetical protein
MEIGEDGENKKQVVSSSNNSNTSNKKTSSKDQWKAPDQRDPRGESDASFVMVLILQTSALSANNQLIKRRAV